MICTFIVDFSAAHRMASSASDNGNVFVMYFSTCSGCCALSSFSANRSSALSMGPHRLPTTLISSMTNGAALNFSPAAHVDLRTYQHNTQGVRRTKKHTGTFSFRIALLTKVPIGRHKPELRVSPAGLPVASTTTSYLPA
jgi:hypothetical protein